MTGIEVTARTNTLGKVLPIRFIWDGKEYPILGIGRRWQAEDGEHILVMVPGDRVVELIFRLDHSWALKPIPKHRKRWFV